MAIDSRLVGYVEDGNRYRFNESILCVGKCASTVEFWDNLDRTCFKYYLWDCIQLLCCGILSDLTDIETRIFNCEVFLRHSKSPGITASVVLNNGHILAMQPFVFVEAYDFVVRQVPEFNDVVIKLLIFFAGISLIFLENKTYSIVRWAVYNWHFNKNRLSIEKA